MQAHITLDYKTAVSYIAIGLKKTRYNTSDAISVVSVSVKLSSKIYV